MEIILQLLYAVSCTKFILIYLCVIEYSLNLNINFRKLLLLRFLNYTL